MFDNQLIMFQEIRSLLEEHINYRRGSTASVKHEQKQATNQNEMQRRVLEQYRNNQQMKQQNYYRQQRVGHLKLQVSDTRIVL